MSDPLDPAPRLGLRQVEPTRYHTLACDLATGVMYQLERASERASQPNARSSSSRKEHAERATLRSRSLRNSVWLARRGHDHRGQGKACECASCSEPARRGAARRGVASGLGLVLARAVVWLQALQMRHSTCDVRQSGQAASEGQRRRRGVDSSTVPWSSGKG